MVMSQLGVYMLRQFMISQPKEYEEAALVEGASYWSIFRRVSLPQMAPAMASLAIITFTAKSSSPARRVKSTAVPPPGLSLNLSAHRR